MMKLTAREEEIVNVLEVFGMNTRIEDIAQLCSCSRKNVSSYLTYLRGKGYAIPRHKSSKQVVKPAANNDWLAKYEGKWAN